MMKVSVLRPCIDSSAERIDRIVIAGKNTIQLGSSQSSETRMIDVDRHPIDERDIRAIQVEAKSVHKLRTDKLRKFLRPEGHVEEDLADSRINRECQVEFGYIEVACISVG